MGSEKVRVFVVKIYTRDREPRVYRESLSGEAARALARSLTLGGIRASVIRFDVAAKDLDVRLVSRKRARRSLPVTKLRSSA